MGNDIKVIIGIIVFTVFLIVGLALWQGGSDGNEQAQPLAQVAGVQINPETYDLENVDLNGGLVTKEYEIKNETDQIMKIKKIVTTCMCTEAKVSVGDKESRFFGMEHPGDRNPPLNYEIPSGGTAKVTASFDPAAHGPQGVGPFDRIVILTFSEPVGVINLTFGGTVVRQ